MKTHSFNVIPNLPENLKKLADISMNMWFTWNWEAIMMMVGMDEGLWHKSHRNPKWVLGSLPPERLDELSRDPEFLKRLESVWGHYQDYLKRPTWFEKYRSPQEEGFTAAYFSMEYGIGEGLPIYSGGLGMLSGDHLKTASDLGLPVIGVGLLYQKGYIQQVLNRDFWQVERYPENDWYNMPVILERDKNGEPIFISIDYENTPVKAQIWRVEVGRVKLYLLDTNILIYAQDDKSPHIKESSEILQQLNEEKFKGYITIQNLLEYSAVLTRLYKYPKSDVVADLKILSSNPKLTMLYPNDKTISIFLSMMEKDPKLYVYDLFLVAYMKAYGIKTIITDDMDFEEIKDIEVLNPF